MFFSDLAFKLSKHTEISNHTIELVDGQQLYYKTIYNLALIELETLKAYIEINLANAFIRPLKLSTDTLIFYDRNLDKFF